MATLFSAGAATYNKNTHAEDTYQYDFLFCRQRSLEEKGYRDGEEASIGADIEASLCNGVMLKSCTLRRRRWHCPVSFEWPTGKEESELSAHIATSYVQGDGSDVCLVSQLNCKACVNENHARFERVDGVQHGLSKSVYYITYTSYLY